MGASLLAAHSDIAERKWACGIVSVIILLRIKALVEIMTSEMISRPRGRHAVGERHLRAKAQLATPRLMRRISRGEVGCGETCQAMAASIEEDNRHVMYKQIEWSQYRQQ